MTAIKELAPYVIALVVIVGGGAMLIIPTQVPASDLLPFVTATIGSALTWVFANRTQQQTAATTAANIFTQPPVINGTTNGGTSANTGGANSGTT